MRSRLRSDLGHCHPVTLDNRMSRHHLTVVPLLRPFPNAALDATTISRAKLGDIGAFTTIVDTYYQRCLRFARATLRNPDDAEDMVQEAFIRLYRALPQYEERARFESWLFQILGNCCRTANKTFDRHGARTVDERALERLPAPTVVNELSEDDWGDTVRRALAEVPVYNREIFLLHYIEGFSYEEIERITGVRQSALKMRVKRASDTLRARLGPATYRGRETE